MPPVVDTPTPVGPTVTPNPNSTLTPTPFQPDAVAQPPTAVPAWVPSPIPTLTPTEWIIPSSTPFTPLVPVDSQHTQYVLSAAVDYASHSLSVVEAIAYVNHTGETLSSLVLAVEPNLWTGCFWLASLSVNGQPSTNHVLDGHRLEVYLPQGLAPDGGVTLNLAYDLYLPWSASDQIFGYNGSQLNVVNWYPFIVPYAAGSGWILHDPWVVGEHLVYDSADFEVHLRQRDAGQAITIAASAPGTQQGEEWVYSLQNARTFVFSVNPQFASSTTTVGAVVITSYFYPSHQSAGNAILSAAAQAVAVYGARFVPYPRASLSIVETHYQDGMEYDGLVFLSRNFYSDYDGTVMNNLVSIGVHEIAHQWWFGLVGNDQALEPWLDEALCTYSERIFYEQSYPNLVSWWWGFRVATFSPSGAVDISIYQGGSFRPYTNAVYLRGAYFMEALRARVGDDVFNAFLRDYAARYTYRHATAADFFALLREYTGAGFSDILTAYFQRSY